MKFRRRPRFTKAQIEQIRQMRADGAELREVADLWGVTAQYVHSLTRDICPAPDGRHMRWLSKEKLLWLLDAWRPALPTEGLPLPNWVVKRGIGRFPWSRNGQSPVGKMRKAARKESGKPPDRQSPPDGGQWRSET